MGPNFESIIENNYNSGTIIKCYACFVSGRFEAKRTQQILDDWYDKVLPTKPPEPKTEYTQLPVGAPAGLPPSYCECGASFTSFPQLHSYWCPCYRGQS